MTDPGILSLAAILTSEGLLTLILASGIATAGVVKTRFNGFAMPIGGELPHSMLKECIHFGDIDVVIGAEFITELKVKQYGNYSKK